jgi:hypothetical protein
VSTAMSNTPRWMMRLDDVWIRAADQCCDRPTRACFTRSVGT